MKISVTCLALFSHLFLFAQQKGATPIPNTSIPNTSSTYAVVVGISNYQDDGIPDLRFADKDALAFAGFLQSPAGGNLDEDHLKVMINEQATGAQFANALDWLWEIAGENDRVIIYFSGHGDVEKKSITQPGYLLGWDAPSRVYMAGGAMNVRDLNDVVTTLSIQNKAKVILITDACRAGKLSGSGIGGSQATAANLAKQYANEVKILSCQPDEYSIEGEQWGGGRGAFSYHLLDGLMGMADNDADLTVNLKEIGRYLEDYVTEEVAPQNQNPMVIGNKTEKLTDVFPEILEQLKEGKSGQMQLFTPTESRGIEDEALAAADSNVVETYLAFQKAIEDKKFLEPATACADFYYEKLSKEPQLKRLHSNMRRNYAAALQDDAQQVLNKLLKSDPEENEKHLLTIQQEYGLYPKYLQRAAILLGEDHYMFNVLMARRFWFEGYLKDETKLSTDNNNNPDEPIALYKKALAYQQEMPHCWMNLAIAYAFLKNDVDSAEYYAQMVVDAIPNWVLPYSHMGKFYLELTQHYPNHDQKDMLFRKSKEWLDKGLAVDSNHVAMLNELAYWYSLNGEFGKEQEILDRSFALVPLARTMYYKGWGFSNWGKYEEAESAFLKAIELDPALVTDPSFLMVFDITKQYDKFIKYANKSLEMGYLDDRLYGEFAIALLYEKGPTKAIETLNKQIVTDPTNQNWYNALGEIYLKISEKHLAKEIFQKSLTIDPSLDNHIKISQICFNEEGMDLNLEFQKKAMQIEPDNIHSIRSIGGALFYFGKYQEAIIASEYALKKLPNEQFNLLNLGLLYYEKGEYEKAEDLLKTAQKGEIRRQARVLFALAVLYLKTGRNEEAEKALKKAIEMKEGNPPIYWTGLFLRNDRFRDDWEQTLKLLLQWYPTNAEVYLELSKLYAGADEDKKALEHLESALKNGFKDYHEIQWHPTLKQLKENNSEAWGDLMQMYFTDRYKKFNDK